MKERILEIQGVSKSFPGVKALDGVDFTLQRGTVHALVGENGAGKSTLMLILGGVYRPDAGRILLDGRSVSFESPHEANAAGISVVYQELSLVPNLSVAENIFANRQPTRRPNLIHWERLHAQTRELLQRFGSEQIEPRSPVSALSMAHRQVIEILKAMSVNPKILILDEPTSSLTDVEASELFDNIRKLKDEGISVIYISHHLPEIFQIADRVTVLRDGRHVCDAQVSEIDEDFLVSNMVGRKIGNIYGQRDGAAPQGEMLFEARGLSRKGSFERVDLHVRRGEIVGLAGLVGSGRTELGRAIFGAEPAEAGEMRLSGQRYTARSTQQAIRAGVAYLTEDRKNHGLFLDFDVKNNLVANHLGDFCNGAGFLMRGRIEDFARRSVESFRIATPGIGQLVGNLSGGNQQKVLVSAWFGVRPKLLIVDEPTRGVDVGARSDIYQLLRQFAHRGVGIMLISSDLPEVLGISDRVYVMREGRMVGELPREHASEQAVISLATGVQSKAKESER